MPPPLDDETRYRILSLLETNPEMSQRVLAGELGVSLGKMNYCLKALIERGWVKAKNFSHSDNKRNYAYYLTPKGFEEKTRVTVRFLKLKMAEHKEIKDEIDRLRREVRNTKSVDPLDQRAHGTDVVTNAEGL